MEKVKFFICEHCGNLIGMINDSGKPVSCCGDNMKYLEPNTFDASLEKHVPIVEVNGNRVKVTVGAVIHPMVPAHYIDFIYLSTQRGGQRQKLNGEPVAEFIVADGDKPVAAYAYCNLHGLWKSDI